ncbi:FAD-dependent oxidoreductase [Nocardiopsis potens]|uniref:FAD-dependent oxidoreductase n=1 Tax=Nocardiopsis potens TaxID=1246458 RepID=UPI00034AF289|nr:FAD-dependent oxidoreductase [Nocardiopsis potens]
MTERTTCAIVGGGPAGMVLGLLLARGGVEVTVLEKHGDFLRDFRGDTVHPTTMRLLDEIGLGERFAELPQSRIDEAAFRGADGRRLVLADFKRLRVPFPYIAMVPQWDLLDLLARAASEEPSFTLRMDAEATGLLREGGGVAGVRYRNRRSGEEHELRAALTVAADGRHSALRAAAGLVPREFRVAFDAWWLRLPRRPGDELGALQPNIGAGRMAVAIPREGYFQIAYLGPKGDDARMRAAGPERFREQIAACLPQFADRVGEIASMDDVKHLDVRLDRLRRWHTPGLLCIGDAAHAMSPVGGVGINLAVQDAVAAASLLAGALRRGRPSPRELSRVRRRRLPPTVLVQGMQRLLHRAMLEPVLARRRSGPPAAALRLVQRLPWLSALPAFLIGTGARAEPTPPFARRRPTASR